MYIGKHISLRTWIELIFTQFRRDSGELPLGANAKMTGRQMTEFMKQFPQSERTGQTNPRSYFSNDPRTKR